MSQSNTSQSQITSLRRQLTQNPVSQFFLKQREASIAIIGILLILYFETQTSVFLSRYNIINLFQFTAETAIIAAGEVMLLILGEIDLSVGNVYALAPFIMYFTVQDHFPIIVGILAGLLVSAFIGFLNGVVTVVLGIPSFITTLGSLYIINGLTLTISNGFPELTPGTGQIVNIMGGGSYSEMIWAVIVVFVLQFVLSRTRWGMYTFATGGNIIGAKEVGINTSLIKIGNFVIVAFLGGLSGILASFRISSIDPLAGGSTIMFSAIAGAVIGGTALNGGVGTVIGSLIGVIVLSIIKDGFTLLGISAFTFDLILGISILVAMLLNVRLQMLRKAGN